ncbi:MAG: uracil-DNA glycosylase, partial [Isosphaeraceae bacterium]
MADVTDDPGNDTSTERLLLIREVRQRLESLRRAGLSSLPVTTFLPPIPAPASLTIAREEPAATPPEPKPVLKPPPPPPPTLGSLFAESERGTPPVPPEERAGKLAIIQAEVAGCTRCEILAETRTQTVFSDGSPTARLMFIGEAPGAEEDRQGVPFVGRAGQLLTDMITKGMGLAREDVYIANVLKCRPPENRNPEPPEIANCVGYLDRQIAIVRPEYLCVLGKVAAGTLLNTALPLARLRGRWHRYQEIPMIVTYHPAYLLRNPVDKKKTWE